MRTPTTLRPLRHLTAALMALTLLTLATAQQDVITGDDYNLDNVEPYGDIQAAYDAYDSTDTGAIILRQSTPADQHANFDVVGPDDYWEHFDFSDDTGEEYVLDNLAPGLYSVAATDEGLELVHRLVEVRAGEAATVSANLSAWSGDVYQAGTYDPYTTYGTYEGYADTYPGYPYGAYTVGPYAPYGGATGGALAITGVEEGVDVVVTGPNGYSEAFEADVVIEGLVPGAYAIAASGAGTDLAVTTVEIQAGQQLPITPSLSTLDTVDVGN